MQRRSGDGVVAPLQRAVPPTLRGVLMDYCELMQTAPHTPRGATSTTWKEVNSQQASLVRYLTSNTQVSVGASAMGRQLFSRQPDTSNNYKYYL